MDIRLREFLHNLKDRDWDVNPIYKIDENEARNIIEGIEAVKSDVFDKIRADILEEKECAYADFERYKVEYLGQDWEDALDSLPQDDYRYGMERCIEIIDKYKTKSEDKE